MFGFVVLLKWLILGKVRPGLVVPTQPSNPRFAPVEFPGDGLIFFVSGSDWGYFRVKLARVVTPKWWWFSSKGNGTPAISGKSCG